MPHDLNGKVVVVTGGTRGIGKAIVNAFLDAGAVVATCGSKPNLIEELNRSAKETGLSLKGYVCDVTSEDNLISMFESIYQELGPIYTYIHNAGIGCPEGFLTIGEEYWGRIIDLNLGSVVNACRDVLPYMAPSPHPSIIITSSLGGRISGTARGIYAVSKAAVNAYTKALSLELRCIPVRVNAVAPGMIGTEMVKANHPDPEDYRSLAFDSILQRMGEPEEIASAMVFLASSAGRGINGQIMEVTGGKCVVQDPVYSWKK